MNDKNPVVKPFAEFVLTTRYDDIPGQTIERVKDLILDLIGVSAASHNIIASRIGRETCLRMFNGKDEDTLARILFDGRTASLAGAAYAGANQIDSLDGHDGFSLAKGHAGCGLLPALLCFAESKPEMTGREFLTAMVIGYEVACRAGMALHGTVSDYHTSGAWVSLAVAALGVRLMGGDEHILRQGVGIAEYHGPRSQMMREIDNPTMLHDGSGWGSMVGVVSAELALSGFEGAPAITIENEDAAPYWSDLGVNWLTNDQNIKLFPVCRWAHAPIQASLDLRRKYRLLPEDIDCIEILAFEEATRLAKGIPETTGKAQYSISYPVAAALAFGQVSAREVSGETFNDPVVAELVERIRVTECSICNDNFPQDRLGRTIITKKTGKVLDSGIVRAPGEHTNPVDRNQIIAKFRAFSHPSAGVERSNAIEQAIFSLDTSGVKLSDLSDSLFPSID